MSQTRADSRSTQAGFSGQAGERPRYQQQSFAKKNSHSHEQIAVRAYRLWQERGCPSGQELETWLDAEDQLTRRDGNN